MSNVYRAATAHTVEWDEKTHTYWEYEKVVLATDYDALLAVLRRCVGVLAVIDSIGHADNRELLENVTAALAAALEYMEEAKL